MAQAGIALAVVEVEPWVLPAGTGSKVGGEPTAAVDARGGGEVAGGASGGRCHTVMRWRGVPGPTSRRWRSATDRPQRQWVGILLHHAANVK
jgi:hypothetical protein